MGEMKGKLFVVSAPSGSGKTSVLFELMKQVPSIEFSVSATTRAPRTGEKDGVNYHFLSDNEFDNLIKTGGLLEWNHVHGQRYGTLKRTVSESLAQGKTLLLDTDTIGAFNIKKTLPEAVLIFIVPPSPKELQNRLTKRNTESLDRIRSRLEAAPLEIARMPEYDYIIINDTIDSAVSRIKMIINGDPAAEKYRSSNILPTLSEWKEHIHGLIARKTEGSN